MAFFNLTYLGPQDPIKDTCATKDKTVEKKPEDKLPTVATQASLTSGLTQANGITTNGDTKAVDPSRARHSGSYVNYTELMHKHTRHPLGECVISVVEACVYI